MGNPTWTLFRCKHCGQEEQAIKAGGSEHLNCLPGFTHGLERVPVIEAVLTDELVETVARAMYATAGNPRKWDAQPSITREDWLDGARAALIAAGFQEEGRDDG